MVDPTELFIDLVRAETRLYNLVDARIRAAHDGLSVGQLQIIQLIGATTDCRVADIVADIDITVGAASKAIDRIVAGGYCRRAENPHDRRSSILVLTEKGERAAAEGWPTLGAAVAELTHGVVPAADLETTARTLAALRVALKDAGGA